MKNEPENNIIGICANCSNQRRNEFQEKYPECNLKLGDYVKIAVKDRDQVEHMWFIVQSVDGNKIIGQLDNIPVLVTNISLGDEYGFAYKNVEQLYKKEC